MFLGFIAAAKCILMVADLAGGDGHAALYFVQPSPFESGHRLEQGARVVEHDPSVFGVVVSHDGSPGGNPPGMSGLEFDSRVLSGSVDSGVKGPLGVEEASVLEKLLSAGERGGYFGTQAITLE
jgi:hypothetical protein